MFLAALLLAFAGSTRAQDIEGAQQLLLTGKYDDCLQACEKAASDKARDEEWPLLHARALLTVGRYPEAETVVSNALVQNPTSIRLRVLGYETANDSGNTALANSRLKDINRLVSSRLWAYSDAPNIVALGRAALLMHADAKTVLERFFDVAKRADPDLRDVYLASGELALDKSDFALAARTYSEAQAKFTNDPAVLYGLARAYEPNERGKMLEFLHTALKQNENHVPSMLLLADHLVDAEEYTEADKLLTRALKVNPWCPEAWAYQTVLADLRNEPAKAEECRQKALHFWKTNPKVDYLIGLKLSQNYRFTEAAACQRQALSFDPDYLPARIQLAQDLLRLGDEEQGWKFAEQVHQQDGYDVTAYNLVMLHQTMQKFATLTNQDFILRMATNEADLYGDRALELLERAREKLTAKYGITLQQPTTIEIFPQQKDFGVRTFGMPLNPGFLGVCFGCVVTANSPASSGGNPENWEDVLWHEFTHVITLTLTRNKMPRWLSEGISVYEERQADPTWGMRMNPRFRELVLGKDFTPVSELSAAFLAPPDNVHLQFAYYESSLVVEFIIEHFGFDKLKAILHDLGNGVEINEAIAENTAPMKQIEKDFTAYAKAKARALAPGLDWRREKSLSESLHEGDLPALAEPLVSAVLGDSKTNYWKLLDQARKAVSEKQWAEAEPPLKTLVELYPNQTGPGNAYSLLAAVYRGLNQTNQERATLEKWASLDDSAPDAFLRLMDLGEIARDWETVALNARRFLAVNPLVPQPYRFLGRASEELGKPAQAINAYRKLLLLDPPDPADLHFRLARLLHQQKDPAAKRQVLEALEDAPRFREAYRLLLELETASVQSTNSATEVDP